jgi:hypothetical protein
MGGEGVWVETCLRIDLCGVEKKKEKEKDIYDLGG